jgi:hypothetical protein
MMSGVECSTDIMHCNVETGLQTRKCLEKSGLKNITDDLEKMGKI